MFPLFHTFFENKHVTVQKAFSLKHFQASVWICWLEKWEAGDLRWKLLWEVSWPYPVAVTWCSAAFPEPSWAHSHVFGQGIAYFFWRNPVLCVSGMSADSSATALLCCSYHSLPDNTLRSHILLKTKKKKTFVLHLAGLCGWFMWLRFASECWAFPCSV